MSRFTASRRGPETQGRWRFDHPWAIRELGQFIPCLMGNLPGSGQGPQGALAPTSQSETPTRSPLWGHPPLRRLPARIQAKTFNVFLVSRPLSTTTTCAISAHMASVIRIQTVSAIPFREFESYPSSPFLLFSGPIHFLCPLCTSLGTDVGVSVRVRVGVRVFVDFVEGFSPRFFYVVVLKLWQATKKHASPLTRCLRTSPIEGGAGVAQHGLRYWGLSLRRCPLGFLTKSPEVSYEV